MKNFLNNISREEKNRILEMHSSEKKLINEDEILDDILDKIKNYGFDSLDFYEKSVLNDYGKYMSSNKNPNKYSSPEKGYQFKSLMKPFVDLKKMKSDLEHPDEKLRVVNPNYSDSFFPKNLDDVDVHTIYDKDVRDKDDYVATFDGELVVNYNGNQYKTDSNGNQGGKHNLSEYNKIGCYKTIEEFSKKFPVWCYKTFQYYDPKLFTDSDGLNKSSDYPDWWWKLQDFEEPISPYREDDIEREKLIEQSKKRFSAYLKTSRLGCLEVYKKK
jgi:hypothetical protein